MLTYLASAWPYTLLTLAIWITYSCTLKYDFVIDDEDGIRNYDGKFQGWEYGMISRWLRYNICGGNFPSKTRTPDRIGQNGEKVQGVLIPEGKIPWKHHLLSVIIHNASVLLSYTFLAQVFGWKLAIMATLLWAIHPITSQVVGWVSGIGYPLSTLWMFSNLLLVNWYYQISNPDLLITIIVLILFTALHILAVNAQFATMMLPVFMFFMGWTELALIGSLVSAYLGFNIVRDTIKLRGKSFKEQNMGESARFKISKVVLAMKTFMYYLCLTFFPKRMGLFHKWGYHLTPSLQRVSPMFFAGAASLATLIAIFFITDVILIKIAILWFISFNIIFWNFITIQQFVTERYIYIPTLATCLVISYFTQDLIPVYAFILGVLAMRTWAHLPTYKNQLTFYQSNIWNFPDSEVALTNLGVVYSGIGMQRTAMDCWELASIIYPDYDVPYYNLSSKIRVEAAKLFQDGKYIESLQAFEHSARFLEKTLRCTTCHLTEVAQKDLSTIREIITNPIKFLGDEHKRLSDMVNGLRVRLAQPEEAVNRVGIEQSITDAAWKIELLTKIIEDLKARKNASSSQVASVS